MAITNLLGESLTWIAAGLGSLLIIAVGSALYIGKKKGRPDVLDYITEGDSLYQQVKTISKYGWSKKQRLEFGNGNKRGWITDEYKIYEDLSVRFQEDETIDKDEIKEQLDDLHDNGLIETDQKRMIEQHLKNDQVPHRLLRYIPKDKSIHYYIYRFLDLRTYSEFMIIPESKIRAEYHDLLQIDRDIQLRPWGQDRKIHAPMTASGIAIVNAINAQETFSDALDTFKENMEMLTHLNISHAQSMQELDKKGEIDGYDGPGVAGDVNNG